jgi:hypothetical protein
MERSAKGVKIVCTVFRAYTTQNCVVENTCKPDIFGGFVLMVKYKITVKESNPEQNIYN